MTYYSKKGQKWRIFVGVIFVLSLCLLLLRILPHAPLTDAADNSRIIEAHDGSMIRMTLSSDQHYRLWRDRHDISPAIVDALLLKEDRYFYYHAGINPIALLRATMATYIGGDRQGGSTLTMQLARRLYHINSRNIPGKLKQMAAAFWLELRYSKAEILDAYLNYAPMGGNIEGVEAASRIYFHKIAKNLSLNEALALAVIPQSPTKRARFDHDLQTARLRLMSDWQQQYADDPRSKSISELPVQAYRRQDIAFLAPHYTDYVLYNYKDPILKGTLDIRLQREFENILHRYVQERKRRGIVNATALLVDSRDMSIKVMIGSADFFSKSINGQVNGTTARRSPGSTIKPFLYALAIDQGIIHPLSMLKDAPSMFGYFQPENFDGRFVGPLGAQDALIRSRNIPAVWLASQTRRPTLYQFLQQAHVSGLRAEESYGLSIALGGGEMKMTELASLYALLRQDGQYRSLRYLQHEKLEKGEALISPQAAFITRDMLRQNPRPDGLPLDSRGREWPVGWKTGTSWSYNDAWTAGFVGPYVLIVWTGNFNNEGPTAFIGVQTAAPLFFKMADALPLLMPNEKIISDARPENVKRVEVCAASGDLPNQWCPQKRKTWYIPGVSPIKVSTLHQPVMVDMKTGKAACPPFEPQTTRQVVYEFWPSDLRSLFASAGLPRRTPPPINEDCLKGSIQKIGGKAPEIKAPLLQVSYILKPSSQQDKIMLRAEADADVQTLYWFEAQRFLGQVKPGEMLEYRPRQAGTKRIRVSDDRGRTSERNIVVEFTP